jgi:peroxiredoxin
MRSSSNSPGGTGQLFPDATLPAADGSTVSLGDFKPGWDLVMVMLGADDGITPELERLLDALAEGHAAVEAEDGKVLAVHEARAPDGWRWPFPLLADRDGALHRRVGALDDSDRPAPALYVTDHYREIYAALRPGEHGWPESADDVVRWLVFVNIQCPECNAPECDW